ncbi:M15 family metallopeptidase [Paenibacillus rhizovicinus]|uniref:M15 family metallopeptidase n=1 Tax=Paenibacillus rhizovicinus TaxID=2704463 RepID=A0A6C0NUK4_9BACL|nr:M15 family metallopeptidase [Paenibacillus rhizovicinus]QHW29838.1 M15 family metallopeptidase [Paenibacillus rhizovicinus]
MNALKKTVLILIVLIFVSLGAGILSTQTPLFQAAIGNCAKADSDAGSTPITQPNAGSQTTMSKTEMQQFLYDNAASRTISKKDGIDYVTNSTSTLVLVNKQRELDSSYVPPDLVKAPVEFSFCGSSPKQEMRKVAADALGQLFASAKQEGIELKAVSGYRSYQSQRAIFNAYARTHGEEEANTFSAHPGQSEHQTGLAMDVSSASVHYRLEDRYGDTKEGKWLKAHAAEFGFIVRYEKGKETETGYMYEPWHVRYVGVDPAKEIQKSGITLEVYLARF